MPKKNCEKKLIFFAIMLDTNYAFCYYSSCRLHGACSSAVESQIVDLVVVGSKPTRHPANALRAAAKNIAFVAQLDRAMDFESGGCTFKSCRTHDVINSVNTESIYGRLAQLVEQQTLNLWVGSSILPSLSLNSLQCREFFFI